MSEPQLPAWVNYVSGAAAGLADTVVNYPPYSLHYRLGHGQNIWALADWRKYWTPRELYRGVFGYSAIIPITCITDGLTQYLKSRGVRPDLAPIYSGMVAATIVSAPTGNYIVNDQLYKLGLRGSLARIYQVRGMRGFYNGLSPLIVREGIYSWSVFFGKDWIQMRMNCGDLQASAVAGTIATAISQPFDTLATVMHKKDHRATIQECVKEMWTEGGIRRFYRGVYFRWFAIISGIYVMNSVSQTVKEEFSKRLGAAPS